MKRLIVNADDYGRAASVSAGIRQAHRAGIVTSTTAMMNMPGIEAELRAALGECPRLGLGVHLTLTAGEPVLTPEQLPTLTALAGGPQFPSLAALLAGLPAINPAEVRAEWQAQIEKFVRLTGRPPTHLDSHHHTCCAAPAWFAIHLDLARELGCAIRLPLPATEPPAGSLRGSEMALLAQMRRFAPAMLAAAPVPHPDYFEPGFYGDGATRPRLLALLAHLPDGVTEIMCHPGLPDDNLSKISTYSAQRAQELAALTASEVRRALVDNGVELVSFDFLT